MGLKNLKEFVLNTINNGGYYLGRYEASQGEDEKVKSQFDKMPWSNILQQNAAKQARKMYENSYIESDLVNSYAWDTAIVFIQKYSENSNYANKTSLNSSKMNTGKSGDRMCNIYDMASNCYEWDTEYVSVLNNECVHRGGSYYNTSTYYAACRSNTHREYSTYAYISFRPLLYISSTTK